jgi:hypothetical protein
MVFMIKKWICVLFGSLGVIGMLYGLALGESYGNGSEGLKCSTLPPPGVYYKMYNSYITSDDLMDPNGDEIPIDFEIKWFANVNRFIWIYGHLDFLGADIGADFIVPIWHRDTKIGAFGVDDREWAIGDIFIEPLDLAWHGERYDLGFAVGLFLPTGEHDTWADPGEDMYTTMFTLGGTYYFDKAKTWTFSLLSRYEIHSRKRTGTAMGDDDVKPGDDFHFEWGLGKTLAKVWDVGVVGYCQWQLKEDKGTNAPTDKDEAYAIGPEVSMFYPPWMTQFSLRSLWEFGVEGRSTGRPEGNRTFLVITKIF